METQHISTACIKCQPRIQKTTGRPRKFALLALTSVAFWILSGNLGHADGPTNPAVAMAFSEGTGTTTTNSGFLGGVAYLNPGTTINGYPMFTNNVPTGPYAPAGNSYSMDMGIVDTNGGGRTVDLTTMNGPSGTLGSFIGGMTICGWLNSQDNLIGSGGNRIAFALESPGGLGFDLIQQVNGALAFNVNQYNTAGPMSSYQMISQDPSAATNNWVFFAVTYDPNLTSGQVKFYFGRANKLAGFDSAVTYFGGPTNQIEYTGLLTVGNFSQVEGQYAATGTASRTYRGLIDELTIYTNVLTIDGIQQAQLQSQTVPAVPAAILRQPTNVTVTAGPLQTATFTVDANGSGLVTYQWRTNGVAVPNATNASFALPADTTKYSGTLVSVYVDNALTPDPGILSATALLIILTPLTPDGVIPDQADVFVDNTGVYNAWSQDTQINWGLGASSGLVTGQRRSYLQFTLGTNLVSSAKFRLWNYWGGPTVNGQGRLAQATSRVYGTITNLPLQITEPPAGTHSDPTWISPDNSNFVQIASDIVVGPAIGWYEWDITPWYNACRGQTTTIMLRGSATSGFDFPLYEDREGTAYTAGAGGSATNTGPRIEIVFPPLQFVSISVVGGSVIMRGSGPPGFNYVLLSSTNIVSSISNWTRLLTNQFDASGNFSVTNASTPAASQRFYRLLRQ